MIKFSSQKKKKRNCQNLSLFTCGWLVGEPSCPFFFFFYLVKKIFLALMQLCLIVGEGASR